MWDGLPHWPVPEVWCGFWITGITHGFVSAVLDWKYEWSLSRGRGEQRRGENKRSTWKDLRTEPRRKKNKMSKLLSLSDGALSRKDSYWFSKNQCNLLIVLTSLLKKEFNNLVNKLIHFLAVKKSLWSSWICISHLICQIPPPIKTSVVVRLSGPGKQTDQIQIAAIFPDVLHSVLEAQMLFSPCKSLSFRCDQEENWREGWKKSSHKQDIFQGNNICWQTACVSWPRINESIVFGVAELSWSQSQLTLDGVHLYRANDRWGQQPIKCNLLHMLTQTLPRKWLNANISCCPVVVKVLWNMLFRVDIWPLSIVKSVDDQSGSYELNLSDFLKILRIATCGRTFVASPSERKMAAMWMWSTVSHIIYNFLHRSSVHISLGYPRNTQWRVSIGTISLVVSSSTEELVAPRSPKGHHF